MIGMSRYIFLVLTASILFSDALPRFRSYRQRRSVWLSEQTLAYKYDDPDHPRWKPENFFGYYAPDNETKLKVHPLDKFEFE